MNAPNLPIARRVVSNDRITTKYVFETAGSLIETSYVDRTEKHIICFSTGVGCPIGCVFCCATAFKRPLTADELVAQCVGVYNDARVVERDKPVLFSAMGEGEPLVHAHACDALMEAVARLALMFPQARFAASTTAIQPKQVRRLADGVPEGRFKLQISLHGANDGLRGPLIPARTDFESVVEAGRHYESRHPGRLEWNYVLIDGLNDRPEDALSVARLLGPGSALKLNRLNPIPGSDLKASARAAEFAAIARSHGLSAEHYATDGVDIAAACGQLQSRVAAERAREASSA